MNYHNYRLQIAKHGHQVSTEFLQQSLKQLKILRLVRVSIDMPNSISLLSSIDDPNFVQQLVTKRLLQHGITLVPTIEHEVLCQDTSSENEFQCCHHHSHNHDHSDHLHSQNSCHDHDDDHHHEHHEHHEHDDHEQHDHHEHDDHHHEHDDHHHEHDDHHHEHDDHHHENHWSSAAIGLSWGAGLLLLSLTGLALPASATMTLGGITTLMTLYLGKNVYQSAWAAMKEKKYDSTTLYTISTLTITLVSVLNLFIPGLPAMSEAAPFILGFWHLGEAIEHSLVDKIAKNLDVRDCISPTVILKNKGNPQISVHTIVPNDVLIIQPGQVIPVDGVINEKSLLYTTRVDGSPYVKTLSAGSQIKSGMQLPDSAPALVMRATKTYQNSYLSLVAQSIKQASQEKAPVEVFANKILEYFVPGLVTVAVTSGIILSAVVSPSIAIQSVISILVSACPCALSLITPMAVKIAMKKASDSAVTFKNGKSLQAAAGIDTIVFDLNGTITQGQVIVSNFAILHDKYLPYIAVLEKLSDHPAAKVIINYIKGLKIKSHSNQEFTVSSLDKTHHSGIKATIDNKVFMIGNKDMLAKHDIHHFPAPYNNPENGSIYMVRGKTVIGQVALTDPLREDAMETVQQLQNLGIAVHMCTGASQSAAEEYAQELGIPISQVAANTVGAELQEGSRSKRSYIEQLKEAGRHVAMVGDAANDASAIACADLGIAIRSQIGDSISEQHADMVIAETQLRPIADAFDIAQKAKSNIYQNLTISLTYNTLVTLVASGLFLGLGLSVSPIAGVALMIVESVLVMTNLNYFKHQPTLSSLALDEAPQGAVIEDPSHSSQLLPSATPSSRLFQELTSADTTFTSTNSNYEPLFFSNATRMLSHDSYDSELSDPSSGIMAI